MGGQPWHAVLHGRHVCGGTRKNIQGHVGYSNVNGKEHRECRQRYLLLRGQLSEGEVALQEQQVAAQRGRAGVQSRQEPWVREL